MKRHGFKIVIFQKDRDIITLTHILDFIANTDSIELSLIETAIKDIDEVDYAEA